MGIPYFLSAQLDGTQDQIDNPKDTSRLEGWLGLLVFNVFVWVTVVALDIHLLAFEFNDPNTQVHVLQMAALVTVSIAASVIAFFTLVHFCSDDRPFSSGDGKEARMLPPFATALISGGLKATLGFSYVILLLNAPNLSHDSQALKILVSQVCLKHFGAAMALANARLKVYTAMHVVSAVS
jgi:hypothetical protein